MTDQETDHNKFPFLEGSVFAVVMKQQKHQHGGGGPHQTHKKR